jgi:large subunit ribosomal protein L6e
MEGTESKQGGSIFLRMHGMCMLFGRFVPLRNADTHETIVDFHEFQSLLTCSSPVSCHRSHQPPRIRKSITPGTVLILLAGRFRGKRVVCLKALESGLLLVSGPFKINGVPLRRVNQAYVIATSMKLDVSGVDVTSITDEYFARSADSAAEGETEFFMGDAPKPAIVSDQRKADQKKVDDALAKAVETVPMLAAYLSAQFTLNANDKPHLMKF